MPSSRRNSIYVSLCLLLFLPFPMYWWSPQLSGRGGASNLTLENGRPISNDKQPAAETLRAKQSEAIIRKAAKITASPVEAPYKYKFSEVGRLTQLARGWVQFLDEAPLSEDTHVLHDAIEGAITTLFPYLRHSPRHSGSRVPFKDLRDAIIPGSRGLVIPTGKTTMRHAAHLIRSLQDVLDTQLRILIVYAGDQDFPPEDRDKMQSRFMNVEFMDILTVVDDSTLQLGDGGWAIKAFAALYAPFEEVILADADCVFVQPPELLYDDPLYIDSGALLFHDRLLWQHAYRERHEWWQSQIQDPSATLNKSLVWTEDYAEEGDSGVVLLNKSRLDVLMGLLHISWQNTKAVRDEVTYKMTHGDKESWWLGLELSGSNYTFERHYGSMVGWPRAGSGKAERSKVCSFYIAHVDAGDALFWYNGGLLVNKRWDPETFGVPTHLMIDGKWHKGGDRKEESCMDGVTALDLPEETIQLLEQSIALAKDVDSELGF